MALTSEGNAGVSACLAHGCGKMKAGFWQTRLLLIPKTDPGKWPLTCTQIVVVVVAVAIYVAIVVAAVLVVFVAAVAVVVVVVVGRVLRRYYRSASLGAPKWCAVSRGGQ